MKKQLWIVWFQFVMTLISYWWDYFGKNNGKVNYKKIRKKQYLNYNILINFMAKILMLLDIQLWLISYLLKLHIICKKLYLKNIRN